MLVVGEPTDADVDAVLTTRPTAELSKCYVLPGHHGTGVASALVTRTLEAARVRGAAAVWLGVNDENAKAQRFYAKAGFERIGRKRFLVGDRYEDDFVMERVLAFG
jgi:ribosomal protein S18 acetylase RimI-like enzyme